MSDAALLLEVGRVAAAYPAATFSEATCAIWLDSLRDLPVERIGVAVRKLIATSKFCPSIAEVRAACLEQTVAAGELSPAEAWGVVLDTIGKFGWNRTPRFDDPLVERALQCTVRWHDLCTSDVSEAPSHRARFLAAYETLQRRARDGQLLPAALRAQIEDARREFVAGVLEDQPGATRLTDRARVARTLLQVFGDGGQGP